eukprot:12398260-Karenia_brevis.AAC.1
MYHCVVAAVLGPTQWGKLSLEDKILHARLVKNCIVNICKECGDDETACRLAAGDTPSNYPGIKELKYFVKYLGGAVHVIDQDDVNQGRGYEQCEFITKEGDGEPLLIFFHCSSSDGAGVECREHFNLFQSNVSIESCAEEDLSDIDLPVSVSARASLPGAMESCSAFASMWTSLRSGIAKRSGTSKLKDPIIHTIMDEAERRDKHFKDKFPTW